MQKQNSINCLLKEYGIGEVYSQVALYLLKSAGIIIENIANVKIKQYFLGISENNKIFNAIISNKENISLKTLEELYLMQIAKSDITSKGIVYSPEYIVDFILEKNIVFDINISNKKFLDPACGCGIFLLRIIEKVKKISEFDLIKFIENNLFGIDIDNKTIEQTEFLINILLLTLGYNIEKVKLNLVVADSLMQDWEKLFKIDGNFNYIVGNPPYVKVQNINKEYLLFLNKTFKTMRKGSVNIFYAFIEKSIKHIDAEGKICFILPNNILKIKAASDLRSYISKKINVIYIVDFDSNMIFAPTMTYNCIITLGQNNDEVFDYTYIEKTADINKALNKNESKKLPITLLGEKNWLFHDQTVCEKVRLTERFDIKFEKYVRTGIATLRDKLYFIDKSFDGKHYKYTDDNIYEIETNLVKPIYKISNIKEEKLLNDYCEYIIFPYQHIDGKTVPISEEILRSNYPKTYSYFLSIKNLLAKRSSDKGMENWYQYGRSQSVNNYGEKLLFPQFLNRPKFIYCSDKDALFCNGFAVFENDEIPLKVLKKVLCSSVFEFYISKVSYKIDGGYYCYQKKYLSGFSIPLFTKSELQFILDCENNEKLNEFLEIKYFGNLF